MTPVSPTSKLERATDASQRPAESPVLRPAKRPGKPWHHNPWIWIIAAIVIGVVVYLRVRADENAAAQAKAAAAAAQMAAVPVTAVTAEIGTMNHYLTALGTVTPLNTVTIKTRVNGEIMEVLFKEGQNVKAGQLLIQIDPRPYQVQLEQAQGTLAKDQASLANAKILLSRDEELYKENVIAEQDLDNQRTTVDQDAGMIITDKANVDNAKLQLTYARITSPIDGRIGLRLVDPGNYVTTTQDLVVVTQIEPISTIFSIPEDDLPEVLEDLHAGQQPEVLAYDRDFKTLLATGKLMTTDNEIATTTGTIKLKALFPNTNGMLFPNQFVNAKLLVSTTPNVVLVPAAAVQRGSSQGSYVYVVGQDRKATRRTVTVGATEGDIASIASGLRSGEVVVTDGVDRLHNGALVDLQMASNNAAQENAPQSASQ